MELRQLEYFEAVSRLKSYTKAAGELFISQPSITVAIRKLEEELGVKLIERDNKTLYLTPEGEVFLEHSQDILRRVKETIRLMKDIQPKVNKVLKLGFPPALGAWMWSLIYPDFTRHYPWVDIQIEDLGTREIIGAVQGGDIDLGLAVLEMVDPVEMECLPIKQGEVKVLIHQKHALGASQSIPLEALADETYIQYKKNTTYIECKMLESFEKHKIKPKVLYVKEQSTAYDLVSKGHGFTVTLDDSISMIKGNPDIVARSFSEPIHFQSGLIWHKDKYLSEAARAFIQWMNDQKHS